MIYTIVLLILTYILGINCLELTINPGDTKCFIEDVTKDTLIIAHFHIINIKDDGQFNFNSIITSPSGATIYESKSLDIDYSFTSAENGEYKLCIYNYEDTQHIIDLTFISGVEAKDFRDVAKINDLKPLERELNQINEVIYEIKLEIEIMRDRESEIRILNESINNRIIWSSIFSLIVLIALAIWQSCYMKEYLKEKKII